jgi:hypothetical protein
MSWQIDAAVGFAPKERRPDFDPDAAKCAISYA